MALRARCLGSLNEIIEAQQAAKHGAQDMPHNDVLNTVNLAPVL